MADLASVPKGGYLDSMPATLREKYTYAKTSFESLNLGEELAALRMLMGKVLEGFEERIEPAGGCESCAKYAAALERASKVKDVVALCKEIREVMKVTATVLDRSSIGPKAISYIQVNILRIMRDELKDDEAVARVSRRIAELAPPRDS